MNEHKSNNSRADVMMMVDPYKNVTLKRLPSGYLVLGLESANLIPHVTSDGFRRYAGKDPAKHHSFLIIDRTVLEGELLEHGQFPGINRSVVRKYAQERVLHDRVRA
jgi:hypothetical protein